jgi:hypothetical protein
LEPLTAQIINKASTECVDGIVIPVLDRLRTAVEAVALVSGNLTALKARAYILTGDPDVFGESAGSFADLDAFVFFTNQALSTV